MSTAILLSSSPSRIFARSPTSADSSPYLPSPSDLFSHGAQSPKRFKTSAATRDGFCGGFSSARSLLAVKPGAENLQLASSTRERFKPSKISSQIPVAKFSPQPARVKTSAHSNVKVHALNVKEAGLTTISTSTNNIQQPAADEVSSKSPDNSFLSPEGKAIPRRTDWTPIKDNAQESAPQMTDSEDASISFPKDLMASFGFGDLPAPDKRSQKAADCLPQPVKRRKVDLVEDHPGLNPLKDAARKIQTQSKVVPKKRTKSPVKKPMTITHIATSHYFGKDIPDKESPMLQFLNATQARNLDVDLDEIEVLSKATKQKAKRAPSKKTLSKSKLLSPKSALQSLNAQDTIFGSASQLVHHAGQPVTTELRSDSLSPQRTQPISIASTTPQTERGTARYVKTRNLWAAAGRDEDNALLHTETIDLCDTPRLKEAFTGKDALVAPAQINSNTREPRTHRPAVPFGTSLSPFAAVPRISVLDIDDFASPLAQLNRGARALHTAPNAEDSAQAAAPSEIEADAAQNHKSVSAPEPKPKPKVPKKPSYAGLDTSILQKQLKTYGFKPVKKREKMIELLEKCWEAKYGKQQPSSEPDDDSLKHGDFLSKVHDVASRPEPKVKKPVKRTKIDASGASPVKEAKRQKKADSTARQTVKEVKVKKPRKSRSKKAPVSEGVVDPEGIDFETVPPHMATATDVVAPVRKSTPPLTLPPSPVEHNSAQGVGSAVQDQGGLGEQIQAAILQQSEASTGSGRDHVRNPTWHEKILMYDPIILEDLTAWLNTEGLNQIKEDREVSTFDVRAWCESKGICCLWKGGWRGQKLRATED